MAGKKTEKKKMPKDGAPMRTGRTDGTPSNGTMDPADYAHLWARIAERSRQLLNTFATHGAQENAPSGDPAGLLQAFYDMTASLLANPGKLTEAQFALWGSYFDLWRHTTQRMFGGDSEPVTQPSPDDRRFKDAAWQESPLFDFIKQSYLLSARWLQSTVQNVEGLDSKTAQKVNFYTRQFVDAMAPGNFILTNPEVLRTTIESKGENLIKGLENLLTDLERGKGKLDIRMTDPNAFEVGRNLAITPGKVIFENDLMQLIQYAPATKQVHRRPLLVIPPWINKYYILDLKPSNSLIKWAVEQGHTVFVISWVNPDTRLARRTFADYLREGPLAALDVIEQATGERQVNAMGYCLGGTLLACLLAWLSAKKKADRVTSATFLATMVDFSKPGELSVFIDDHQLAEIEEKMRARGYLEGRDMASTFNMLRANDLIWSFVINNYLLGRDPFPFDLLYWNSDTTRMPAAMHSFYLRQMYHKNRLAKPGGITLEGVPIDLGKIKTPCFILATREDHIVPWESAYAATQLYRGPIKFVLAASGHIAGVINPPAAQKYQHWTNPDNSYPATPTAWLAKAQAHPGSWWPVWQDWIGGFTGAKIPTRKPGEGKLKPLGDAPGSYVKVSANP